MAPFGGNIDVDVVTDAVGGEPGESLEVAGLDGQDERGLDGEVEACIIKMCKLVSV